jgi:predicted ArsR family transcriptional regulator
VKYKKITLEDIEGVLCSVSLGCYCVVTIRIKEIAKFLETSNYQVKKQIEILRKKEFVEIPFASNMGYCITEKYKQTDFYEKSKKGYEIEEENYIKHMKSLEE